MALDKHDASQNSCSHSTQEHCGISSVGADDESEWLHRNYAYHMHHTAEGLRPILVARKNSSTAGSLTQLSGKLKRHIHELLHPINTGSVMSALMFDVFRCS